MKKVVSYLAVLFVSLFTFIGITNAESKYPNVTKIDNVDISTGQKIIYLGRDGCGYCQLFVPGLKYLSEKYGFTYEYVNTDKLSEKDLEIWIDKLQLNIDVKEFGTPTFGVFQDGVLKDSNIGFLPEESLFYFLQNAGVIGSDKTYEVQFKNINFISDNDYIDIVNSGKKSLVMLSQVTCLTCLNSKSFLDELAQELNVEINYYDIQISDEESYNKFYNSSSYIKEKIDEQKLMLPTILVIKGNEVLGALTEYSGKEDVKKFINDYLIGDKVQTDFDTSSKPTDYKVIVIVILGILLVGSIAYNVVNKIELSKTKKK